MQRLGGVVILMNREKVEVFAGGWDFSEVSGKRIFSDEVLDFLDELSKEIRKNPKTSSSKEAVSFAFWCRKQHVLHWRAKTQGETRMGWGLIFHIAPSNIPVLFAYSMVFGLLSGNGNVIRISQRTLDEARPLCEVIDQVMRNKRFKNIYQNNQIISYEKDSEITKELSAFCDGRVLWGGDFTMQEMRKFPMKPGNIELAFADRTSIAVFDADWMNRQREEEIRDLAYRFYNDTLLMDQNACSSPKVIFWVKNSCQNIENTKKRWWQIFSEISKDYDLTPWKSSKKYEQICYEVMEFSEISKVKRYGNEVYVIELGKYPEDPEKYKGKFGCFYEYEIQKTEDICRCLNRKVQTIIYEGIDVQRLLKEMMKVGVKGADRIVLAGGALELDEIWDGKDVIRSLSRNICIK